MVINTDTRRQARHLIAPIRGVHAMGLGTIFLIILVVLAIGALPRWRHSANWGYYPSGALGLALLVIVALLLTERI
jgi:hypothetical protein